MGKIIETTYHDTVSKITEFNSSLINNSFYTLNDKKPSIVTYYNINTEASSLDQGAKIAYNNIGSETPLRFNRINNFIIYGFNRIELQTENDEFGLEADKITGDCIILPNTIIPYEGDYFEVEHIKDSTWLFIVTDVQQDTLENGSNAYKITYKLEYVDHQKILNNVVEDFNMIEKREGTNVVKIVESSKLEKAKNMDKYAVMLKKYFNELFYNDKVQTFIYMDLYEYRVYDPYMIEFLIRNKILDNGLDSFIYVCHQLAVKNTFSMDYDTTFFRVFEKRDPNKILKSNYTTQLEEISSYGTTFSARFESYYKAKYILPPVINGYRVQCLSDDLLYRIYDHNLVEDTEDLNEETPLWLNIIVKYFYNEDFTDKEINSIEDIHYDTSVEMFYMIQLLILCLEDAIEKALN